MSIKVTTFTDNNPPACDAEYLNSVTNEVNNTVSSTGATLSGSAAVDQLGKAISVYSAVADFYSESGVADAYVVSATGSLKAPTAYFNGMRVRFRAGNNNTGASTINVNSLGVKNIYLKDGTTTLRPDNISAARDTTLIYDSSLNGAVGAFTIEDSGVTIGEGQPYLYPIVTNGTQKIDMFPLTSKNMYYVSAYARSGSCDVDIQVNAVSKKAFTTVNSTEQTHTFSPIVVIPVGATGALTFVITNNSSCLDLVITLYADEVA